MVHLNEMPPENRDRLINQEVPVNDGAPWTKAPDIGGARIAIVTTAGLHRKDDRPFRGGAGDYRVIPGDVDPADLRLSHVSTNFDRIGWQHDINTVFPIERLREMAADGTIGSVASYHYSFMGATAPENMEAAAHDLSAVLKGDKVDTVLLMGV